MVQVNFALLIVALVGILHYPTVTLGAGINCYGDVQCAVTKSNLNQIIDHMCNQLPPDQRFGPEVRISTSCHELFAGGIVAFTRNTKKAITAGQGCNLLRQLKKFGCNICGSIPLGFADGELTVDYVFDCDRDMHNIIFN